jgi:predicted nucleotidyltransferase
MQTELDILRDVTKKFDEAGIQYMLTGSFALNYYAEPRMTRDIDIVVALTQEDADSVATLFERDYYVPRNAVVRAIANQTLFNIIHSESIVKVDCIVRKNTEYRRLEFERRRQVQVDSIKIWIVSKEDLIISKLYWAKDSHSEFQLRDVKNLLKSDYDAAYLETWTNKLELDELLKECLDE